MNYKLHYDKLIHRAQNRSILKSEYKEVHHIIPECMDGLDTEENKVVLFAEEHLIAHLLLVKIYPKNHKLIHAANMMTNGAANIQQKERLSNKTYSWVRKKHAECMSKNNPMFLDINKKIHSDKMKEFNKTYIATDETNMKIANTVKASWESNVERKKQHSERFRGKNNPRFDNTFYEFIHKDGTSLICYQSELQKNYGGKVWAIINGERKTTKGWRFTGRKFQRIEI